MRDRPLTEDERHAFAADGYILVRDAVPAELRGRLTAAIDARFATDERVRNTTDAFAVDPSFVELVDLPAVLPKVCDLLGDNIWVNHTHINWNPPTVEAEPWTYGWHRDGGMVLHDLGFPLPLLFLKVGFYLTDVSEGERGQTYAIPGSHLAAAPFPERHELPPTAEPIRARSGDAVIYDYRLIHSLRSPNFSQQPRRAVFLQYAFRWLGAASELTVDPFVADADPVRRQLLGISRPMAHDGRYVEGRSSTLFPSGHDIPLRHQTHTRRRHMRGRGLRRWLSRRFRALRRSGPLPARGRRTVDPAPELPDPPSRFESARR